MKKINKIWTEKEIVLLRKLYPDKSISKEEISDRFKRTWAAIRTKARSIGLSLRTNINYWSLEDIEKLKELNKNPDITSKDIGVVLNRVPGTVRSKLFELGLERPKREKKEFNLDNVEDHLYE